MATISQFVWARFPEEFAGRLSDAHAELNDRRYHVYSIDHRVTLVNGEVIFTAVIMAEERGY